MVCLVLVDLSQVAGCEFYSWIPWTGNDKFCYFSRFQVSTCPVQTGQNQVFWNLENGKNDHFLFGNSEDPVHPAFWLKFVNTGQTVNMRGTFFSKNNQWILIWKAFAVKEGKTPNKSCCCLFFSSFFGWSVLGWQFNGIFGTVATSPLLESLEYYDVQNYCPIHIVIPST